MKSPVSSIRNLGPASDQSYARAGITSAEQLRDLGPDTAYFRYLNAGGTAHFIGYYAMVMGLQGRPWNDCRGREKEQLRERFDGIKAQAKATPSQQKDRLAFEAALNGIGVIDRRSV